MVPSSPIFIGAIIGVALIFDFTNGFHDSANSISTIVSTKVLSPKRAVVFAAFFNLIAAFGFGVAVASTISKIIKLDIVATESIPVIVLGALLGAISWNLITWYFGLPTSSSHALIGGLIGAGIAAAGLLCRQARYHPAGSNLHDHLTDYRSVLRISVHGSGPLAHTRSSPDLG
ncbi:MAG: inorganic phosphate transporter [Methanomicrobiales archaeon]|nr:inorganic phosphate transporter [Methanomicrobiales archaeon]